MDLNSWWNTVAPLVTAVLFKIVGAVVLYMVGRWLSI